MRRVPRGAVANAFAARSLMLDQLMLATRQWLIPWQQLAPSTMRWAKLVHESGTKLD
jgi:hypothetical protein